LKAELVATEQKSPGKVLRELARQTGEFHTERLNLRIAPDQKEAILGKLAAGLDAIGSFKVEKFITTDGYKSLLPGHEWVAFRASGSEPLIRCHIEVKSENNMGMLRAACKALLGA
jgi:phosphomannomutase